VSIEGYLGDRIFRKFEGKGYLISTQRIGKIDLSIGIKQNPAAPGTLVMIEDQLLIHII
jgi:hypothetical protein